MSSSSVATVGGRFERTARPQPRKRRADRGLAAVAETLLLIVVAGLLIAAVVVTASGSRTSVRSERTFVARGESLWELASAHPVVGLTTQQTADLIASMNGLADGQVAAGTVVSVPSRPDSGLAMACR